MAWKFVGIGLTLGAKDQGAIKTTDRLADNMERTDRAMGMLNSSVKSSRLGNFIDSLSLLRLGGISDMLGSIADKANSPELTTSLQATMVGMEKTAASVGVSMGKTGKDLRKFTSEASSLAYNLNTDVGNVAGAYAAMAKAGVKSTKEMGLDSMEDLVKVTETIGMKADDVVGIFKNLTGSYGFTADQARKLMDENVAMGQSLGYGAEQFQAMPEILKKLDEAFAKTVGEEGPEDVSRYMKAISGLAAVYTKQMGGTIPENTQAALAVFDKLNTAQVEMQSLFAGLADEMPGMSEQMARAGFGVDEMFKVLQQDPVEFASRMRDMLKTMKQTTDGTNMANQFLARFKGTVTDLPPQFMYMIEATGEAGATVEAMLGKAKSPVANATGALQKFGREAYRTGLTLDETFQRIKERLKTRFYQVSQKETENYVRVQRQNYDMLGDALEELAADKGPVGQLTKTFSLAKKIGLAALLPWDKARPIISMLGESFLNLATAALPVLTMLSMMGMRPGALAKPFTMLLSPITMVNSLLFGLPGKLLTVFGPVGILVTLIGAFGGKLAGALEGGFTGMLEKLGGTLPATILKYLFGWDDKALTKAGFLKMKKVVKKTKNGLVVTWEKEFSGVGAMWKIIGNTIYDGLVSAWDWAKTSFFAGVNLLADWFVSVSKWLAEIDYEKVFGQVFEWIGKGIMWLGEAVVTAISGVWDFIFGDESKASLNANAKKTEAGLTDKLKQGVKNSFEALGKAIKGFVFSLWERLVGYWTNPKTSFLDKLKGAGKMIIGALAAGMLISGAFRSMVFGGMKSLFGGVLKRTWAFGGKMEKVCASNAAAQQCAMGGGMIPGGGRSGAAGGAARGAGGQLPLPFGAPARPGYWQRAQGMMGKMGGGLGAAGGRVMDIARQAHIMSMMGGGGLPGFFREAGGRGKEMAVSAGGAVKQKAQAAWGQARALPGRAWSRAKQLPGQAWGGMQAMGGAAWSGMKQAPGMAMRGAAALPGLGLRGLKAAGTGILAGGMYAYDKAASGVKRLGGAMSNVAKSEGFRKFGGAIGRGGLLAMGIAGLTGQLGGLFQKMGMAPQAANTLNNALSGAAAGFMMAGPLGAAIGGLLGVAGDVIDFFTDAADKAKRLEEALAADAKMTDWVTERTEPAIQKLGEMSEVMRELADEYQRIAKEENNLDKIKAIDNLSVAFSSAEGKGKYWARQGKKDIQFMAQEAQQAVAGFGLYVKENEGGIRSLALQYKEARSEQEKMQIGKKLEREMSRIYEFGAVMKEYGPANAWAATAAEVKDLSGMLRMETGKTFGDIESARKKIAPASKSRPKVVVPAAVPAVAGGSGGAPDVSTGMNRLAKSLDANTAATERNSRSTGRGAPAEAQEAY